MVQYRLQLVAPHLMDALRRADDLSREEMLSDVCDRAVRAAALDQGPLLEALVSLRAGTSISSDLRARVAATAESLDERYLRAWHDARLAGLPPETCMPQFKRARAAAAVQLALLDDRLEAAAEAIYEWQSILTDPTAALEEFAARLRP